MQHPLIAPPLVEGCGHAFHCHVIVNTTDHNEARGNVYYQQAKETRVSNPVPNMLKASLGYHSPMLSLLYYLAMY